MKFNIKEIIKEAESGSVSHMSILGGIYYSGYSVPIDRGKALEWFVKAAEQGDKYAQLQVVRMKIENCNNVGLFDKIDIPDLFNRLK